MAARAVVEAPVWFQFWSAAPRRQCPGASSRRGSTTAAAASVVTNFRGRVREHRWWLLPLHKQHQCSRAACRAGQGALAELDDVAELLLRSQRIEELGFSSAKTDASATARGPEPTERSSSAAEFRSSVPISSAPILTCVIGDVGRGRNSLGTPGRASGDKANPGSSAARSER